MTADREKEKHRVNHITKETAHLTCKSLLKSQRILGHPSLSSER